MLFFNIYERVEWAGGGGGARGSKMGECFGQGLDVSSKL